ncbi:uracil-DNA glycosylase [Coniophora puteana RWD-64-598 SS2]|uniref:Uracil-DNA glycosylase n=1 Tax=Coniophora puteana (strain RWD-64-598) TaxID=741705 RepID=A0A5M3N237_CONPW|nr:uracil-DNA glycosylase [Coniophora puteana RWD-64-598 SS2]EIW85450.1 uracil-DNA glycosylase [Coniophora puteana RWD-64-598 SS2]
MGESWRNALSSEFNKPYFRKLKEFLISEHKTNTIYPEASNIYSWSRFTPLEGVKIVVLGQDPYHNVGQAHGLSFSVLPPTKLPGSLKNIYKQIQNDVPSFVPPKKTGDLTPLAKAGVLWLNTCLTVRAHTANSHAKKGWETFTDAVIRAILARESVADLTQLNALPRADGDDADADATRLTQSTPQQQQIKLKADRASRGVVFFAWGMPAQKTFDRIGVDETQHLVLRSAHPSPLSAHRGFFGNGHFKQANDWLRERYGEGAEIDWSVLHDS